MVGALEKLLVNKELLAQEQMQLANLHELRVAVKAEAQLRSEHEREELGCKVEFENAPSRHQETGTAGGRKANGTQQHMKE
ncbi:unnamed protein product [Sphagnum troendelagicum]|uniref:Uncharacterized protein n=1 Tax=Sphagnum troendelagicum TaxID=128251 RepID=A0ABP0USN4_9BRYO